MWQAAAAAAQTGSQWVAKLLNKQPQNVSPYFSRNGEYLNNVNRAKGEINTIFNKYASQMPEGSAEANEYVSISKPALEWQGQRNALDISAYKSKMESEGQRLVNSYQEKSIIQKAGDTLNKVTDPISNFFSLFSTKKDEPEQAYLAYPKNDTIIPIILPQEQTKEVTQELATKETGFEKFALPVGIAVVSGIVLFMLRR